MNNRHSRNLSTSGLHSNTFTRLRNSDSGSLNFSSPSSPDIPKYSTQILNRRNHRPSFPQDDHISKLYSSRDEMSKIEKQNLKIEEELLKSFKSTPRYLNNNNLINTNQNISRKEYNSLNFLNFPTLEFNKPAGVTNGKLKSNDFLNNGSSEIGSVKLVPIRVYDLEPIVQNCALHENNPRLNRSKSLARPIKETSLKNLTNNFQSLGKSKKERYEHQLDSTTVNGNIISGISASWYKPGFSRENAINYLRETPTGSFVIRKSSSHDDSYVLVLKTDDSRANDRCASIRNFLIEASRNGLRFKGFTFEPEFENLEKFVEYYKKNASVLPCKLVNASEDRMFHLQYMTTVFTEVDSTLESMKRAFDICYSNRTRMRCAPVKVTLYSNGMSFSHLGKITHLKVFYRYDEIVFCCIDPLLRKLPTNRNNNQISSMCGFSTNGSGEENGCVQIFLLQDLNDIAQFVNDVMNCKESTGIQ